MRVFDVDLLARRLVDTPCWVARQPSTGKLAVAYFGASAGAGAALWAAASPDSHVFAVASRDGRPDLAGPRLGRVSAPTLLVVGVRDDVVLRINRQARAHLGGESGLAEVPGATHIFEEPGALETVATMSPDWFLAHGPSAHLV